jgi:hypothetical protein
MEIRDGFIVGIYNYCDAWCDRCAFPSRCRAFADKCQMEATLDPGLAPVATAPGHPSDAPPPPPRWLQELLDELNEASRSLPGEAPDIYLPRESRVVRERDAIDRRGETYLRRTRAWLTTQEFDWSPQSGDPRAVIEWFHMMIHVKTMRALRGLAGDDPSERDWPPDHHDGSAKVALIGIDRSHTAWLDLVSVGLLSASDVAPFLEDLVWLRAALERTFPNARSFVRTAFDEPEEVARLLQSDIQRRTT